MRRKATRRMLRPALAAVLVAAIAQWPVPALADDVLLGARLARQDAPGGSPQPQPPPAPAAGDPTLADVAGPPKAITLPDVLQVAIRQSPALALARIDIDVAQARIEQSLGLDDWTVGAALQAAFSAGPGLPDSFGDTRSHTFSLSGDLTRLLPTGGTINLHAESSLDNRSRLTRTETPPFIINERSTAYTDVITGTFTQPLLRGYGRDIARATQVQARLSRDAAVLDQTRAVITQLQTVIQAYWDLTLALRGLEIRRSSLELARERLRLTQAGIGGGKVAPSEALAVEQVIATRQEDVLGAELAVLQQSIVVRRAAGMEIAPGDLALSADTQLAVPARQWQLEALVARASEFSPELAALAVREKGATVDIQVTENGLLPTLDLSLTLGPAGVGDDPGTALKNLVTGDSFTAAASLTYQQALGRHAAAGATRAARGARELIRVNAVDVKLQVAQSMASAVALVRSAEQRVQLAARAIALAEQNIAVEQSRFNLGKSTNFDVLLRQDELRQAQLRQANAVVDWHKAETAILALTGELLAAYGVEVAPR